ncbi:hypothetical protein KCU86_g47, partial [Aureobasidium melanogenum]
MSVWRDRVGFDLGPYGREGGNIMFSLPIMSRFSSRSLNRSSMFRFLHWTFLRVIVIGGDASSESPFILFCDELPIAQPQRSDNWQGSEASAFYDEAIWGRDDPVGCRTLLFRVTHRGHSGAFRRNAETGDYAVGDMKERCICPHDIPYLALYSKGAESGPPSYPQKVGRCMSPLLPLVTDRTYVADCRFYRSRGICSLASAIDNDVFIDQDIGLKTCRTPIPVHQDPGPRCVEDMRNSATNQLTFLIDGKTYKHNEVMRRLRRAEKAGRLSPEDVIRASAPPKHIKIVQRPVRRANRSYPTLCDSQLSDYSDESPCSSSMPMEVFVRWAKLMDESSRYYFLQLVHMEHITSLSATPSFTDELFIKAKFFFNIIKYFRGAYDNGQFVHNELGEYVSNVSATSITRINNFYRCCVTAIDLIERGYHIQGFAMVSDALWLIEQLLEERDPKLIDTICDVSVLLLARGWHQMYDILVTRICDMVEIRAAQKREEHQPWAQIEAGNVVTTNLRVSFLDIRGMGSILPALRTIRFEWANMSLSCIKISYSSDDLGDMHRQFTRVKVLFSIGNYHAALEPLQSIISKCTKARKQGEKKWMALEIDALEASARCHYAISGLATTSGDISTAERLLETAITRSTTLWDIKSATTIALKHTLWSWCLEQGRYKEAVLLRNDIDAVVLRSSAGGGAHTSLRLWSRMSLGYKFFWRR